MADPYRAYAPPSSLDRDPRGNYPSYLPPEGSLASLYTSRPPVLPGGPDIRRNDIQMPLQSRAYGLDVLTGVINPALPGVSGLPAGARVQGHSPLQDSTLAGLGGLAPTRAPGSNPLEEPALVGRMGGLAPTRAPGSNPLEEPALVGRSSSLGKSAGISDVERHSPLPIPSLDGPSEDESNILFVDGLPTDCTRREVAHLFRPFVGFKDIRVVHKEPRRSGDKAYVLCFVEFENAKCALTAMEALQGYLFDDRKPDAPFLKIQFARFPFRLPAAQVDRKHLIAR